MYIEDKVHVHTCISVQDTIHVHTCISIQDTVYVHTCMPIQDAVHLHTCMSIYGLSVLNMFLCLQELPPKQGKGYPWNS